ncbi:MAG: class I tRNA ligase family protein, partial [Candidatus Nomurabacteria bacterium]|nr:class I tRNA ligase family protein [Candidatus Nomurabacteria bacterium]
MYVWFDALTSYISTLGWPETGGFEKYWEQIGAEKREVVQYCGKDNLLQQSAIWQGMLLAAGLPNTSNIIIDGFIISGGQKMSKSIGNVINPFDIIEMFKELTDCPEDVLRFILLHEVPSFEDGDLTVEAIKIAYTAYLANGIGNLTSRIMKMATSYNVTLSVENFEKKYFLNNPELSIKKVLSESLNVFDTNLGIKGIFLFLNNLDKVIQEKEPYKLIKTDENKAKEIVEFLLYNLYITSLSLGIFLPSTSTKILECIRENKMPEKPLFNRLP